MYEKEYNLFSIKKFETLFLFDDIDYSDGFLVYIPDDIMDDLLKCSESFNVYIQMLNNGSFSVYDLIVINHIKESDLYNSTIIVTKDKTIPKQQEFKIKFKFKDLKQYAKFKLRYEE